MVRKPSRETNVARGTFEGPFATTRIARRLRLPPRSSWPFRGPRFSDQPRPPAKYLCPSGSRDTLSTPRWRHARGPAPPGLLEAIFLAKGLLPFRFFPFPFVCALGLRGAVAWASFCLGFVAAQKNNFLFREQCGTRTSSAPKAVAHLTWRIRICREVLVQLRSLQSAGDSAHSLWRPSASSLPQSCRNGRSGCAWLPPERNTRPFHHVEVGGVKLLKEDVASVRFRTVTRDVLSNALGRPVPIPTPTLTFSGCFLFVLLFM
ncbi:hypothetical protein TRVL_07795 [Trypanosoma vivax]|nr:hypothetical protein TRVL_07795 [Trypanosoma vivax]